jgi:hypothetical protein
MYKAIWNMKITIEAMGRSSIDGGDDEAQDIPLS